MNDTTSKINRLEDQVSELLELCKRLGKENNDLRAQLQHLSGERASLLEQKRIKMTLDEVKSLLEQKEQVRSQVEAMISRLRSMESA